ncbi:TIGR03885 family FMN-dependent LLM class oxidoreductase [Rhodocytophaga rosea]|uniref:TIGR03885 family FMN-dependent LLM class oxidoreductase n=1 Tax=Rhodocytophaga rosea TaxID=2704465 RepID=A0A6C0GSV9_9BACT|nr:TIGR03885 family FMN-dependent LLM class oxidoreductase [Rhodocytophaga rosea]QHT71229.1 TIGR03885 family FMN-dependent LLM class oxidoreductase [Rhodocytophaga rosea]
MIHIGYHASHEQFRPSQLLKLVQKAAEAGFRHSLSSDHFHPWTEEQGESGFAWSWLGAAMQATPLTFGVVNAPGQRYHPAIIAQAAATLAEMFPDRFWLAQGSGQAVNEHITGTYWPNKPERNARLLECVEVIRALWAGETVNHFGRIRVENAKLYSLPAKPPLIIGTAITEKTAEWVGSWADGLLTISRPPQELKKMADAFYKGGGEGKPMYLKVQLSYAATEEKARQGAFEQWRSNVFESAMLTELQMPSQFDYAGSFVQASELDKFVRISCSPEQHIEWLKKDAELGFSQLYLHNVNREQEQFIEVFGEKVLPHFSQMQASSAH